jgi:hypothetical protein
MDDVFKDAMRQVFNPAPPEMVAGFRRKLGFIQEQYKHSRTTVQSCLEGMSERPTLLELLTAAYVVNGGVLFKHVASEEAEAGEDDDYTRLMREMDELNCGGEASAAPAPAGETKTPAATKGSRSAPGGPALARSPSEAGTGTAPSHALPPPAARTPVVEVSEGG